jgi:formylglycine-generating enzyme required for sulfatase activity
MKPVCFCFLWLFFFALASRVDANNVIIRSLETLKGDSLRVSFSWENAWNHPRDKQPSNHDAVWLFFKYRLPNSERFYHLVLAPEASGYTHAPNVIVKPERRGMGLLVCAPLGFSGDISSSWLAFALPSFLKETDFEIEAHAIEMVYISQEPFYLGDGASKNSFCNFERKPFWVNEEFQTIAVGNTPGALQSLGDFPPVQSIPGTYPKGVGSFYVMKYEISQAQYVAFLNSLSVQQQQRRAGVAPNSAPGVFAFNLRPESSFRNAIRIIKPAIPPNIPATWGCDFNLNLIPNEADDGANRACNFLNWEDLTAYLDWAALRPMTELEFEKIARGPLPPVPREFSFGTPYVKAAIQLENDATELERAIEKANDSTGIASHGFLSPQGPLRAGFSSFAGNASRLQAGASYYGVFELSGNLWEQCVTINEPALLFQRDNGNGELDEAGNADAPFWFTDGSNAIYRGGGWNSGIFEEFRDLAISDRFYAGLRPTLRRNTSGGRGVLNWEE